MPNQTRNFPMLYTMPASENLVGRDTTTLELCESGERTGTTRSYPLGKIGDIITFNNRPQRYEITKIEKLDEINTQDTLWISKWSEIEQWTVEHYHKIFGGKTVHVGSYQTSFRKIPTPKLHSLI